MTVISLSIKHAISLKHNGQFSIRTGKQVWPVPRPLACHGPGQAGKYRARLASSGQGNLPY